MMDSDNDDEEMACTAAMSNVCVGDSSPINNAWEEIIMELLAAIIGFGAISIVVVGDREKASLP
jgi:hypothetical protein